jgi:membrane fusion protein, adhesin transport system
VSQKDQKTVEQKAFESIERVTSKDHRFNRATTSLFNRMGLSKRRRHDWIGDAEWASMEQTPLRGRMMIYGIALTVVALLAWASVAALDEVTRGQGRIIPSRQLQVVQSVDGGVIREIHVQEGGVVEAGDLMYVLDRTRSLSSFQESHTQILALRARIARLTGLIENSSFMLDDSIASQIPEIARREHEHFTQNMLELEERLSVHREQLAQRLKELEEVNARQEAERRNLALASREYEATFPLLNSGAVSEIDVLRLQRQIAQIEGEISQTEARTGAVESAIAESRSRIQEAELSFRNSWRTELSEALAQLRALEEGSGRLADMVNSTEVRAPVRGIVQRVFYNTLGGVIPAGREVAELVPLDDQLLVEARINPTDVAFLRPGLDAVVKLSAYDYTIYGGLDATLEFISADTITDERDNTYFLVRVRTQSAELDNNLPIIPGMTAQVDILTGKRTVLQYLMKPLLRATSNALSER